MRFLRYDDDARVFVDIDTGERHPAIAAELDDLIVAWDGTTAYPIWLVPTDALPPALPNVWSARAARARTSAELAEILAGLDARQADAILQTLPDELLDEWTGRAWPRPIAQRLYEAALDRYRCRLEAGGIQLERLRAGKDKPLDLYRVELIKEQPTQDGYRVPLAALDLPDPLRRGLEALVGPGLYLHQALALAYLRQMRHEPFDLILTTPTASGKTWAFVPGIVEDLLDRGGTALFLYPLRALTIDQEGKIVSLVEKMGNPGLRVASFYGRKSLHEVLAGGAPNLLVATPDKLNYYLDRPEVQWLLAHLRYLVLDEAHIYRGVFGINMALFLRRLTSFASRDMRVVLASATLENTVEFARKLTGRPRFRVVGASSAPLHARYYYLATADLASRPDTTGCAHRSGPAAGYAPVIRSLVFRLGRAETRGKGLFFVGRRSEAVALAHTRYGGAVRVRALMSGVREYRQTLDEFRQSEPPMVIFSTTTLEVGIDIGDLNCVGIIGFPASRNSFKQMAGRAGRTGAAHVLFFPGDEPADQYYRIADNLKRLVDAEADPIYVNPGNAKLLAAHVRRLAWEMRQRGYPPTVDELLEAMLPPAALEATQRQRLGATLLGIAREVIKIHSSASAPAPELRSSSGRPFVVVRVSQAGDPLQGTRRLEIQPDSPPEWMVEITEELRAYREWSLGGTALRGSTYYRVLDWTEGMLVRERGEEAVFIWVEEITDRLAPPEEYNRIQRGLRSLAPGEDVQHYHELRLRVLPQLASVQIENTVGSVQAQAGPGTVRYEVPNQRIRHEKSAGFECSKLARHKTHRAPGDTSLWSIVDSSGKPIPHQPSELAWSDGVLELRSKAPGQEAIRYQVLDSTDREGRVHMTVQAHRYDPHLGGRCSCGAPTTLHENWREVRQETPPSFSGHALFSLVPKTLETDLARIAFSYHSPGVVRPLAHALVKAMPQVLEADPGDFGSVLVADKQQLVLYVYDAVDGGLDLSTQIPGQLPALLGEARRLLELCVRGGCTCEQRGCFGCIVPFRQIFAPPDESSDNPAEAVLLLEEQRPIRVEPSPEQALEFAENVLEPPRPASSVMLLRPPALRFHQLILDLDGCLVHTESITDEERRHGASALWLRKSRPCDGAAEVLEELFRLDQLEIVVATNAPSAYAETLIGHHFPEFADRMLANTIAAAGKPNPTRLRPYIEDSDPARVLLVGDRLEDVLAARRLGIPSTLVGSTTNPAWHALNGGPDFIITRLKELLELLVDCRRFVHPLEAEALPVADRQPPLRLDRQGQTWLVLSRYYPGGRASRGTTSLKASSDRILFFKRSGFGADLISAYLTHHFPQRPVVVIPPRDDHQASGLAELVATLQRSRHPVLPALAWARRPMRRQKEAGSPEARRANVRGAFRAVDGASLAGVSVLLVDDVVTSGATLDEARRTLEALGASVTPLALAYTVWDKDLGREAE